MHNNFLYRLDSIQNCINCNFKLIREYKKRYIEFFLSFHRHELLSQTYILLICIELKMFDKTIVSHRAANLTKKRKETQYRKLSRFRRCNDMIREKCAKSRVCHCIHLSSFSIWCGATHTNVHVDFLNRIKVDGQVHGHDIIGRVRYVLVFFFKVSYFAFTDFACKIFVVKVHSRAVAYLRKLPIYSHCKLMASFILFFFFSVL